VGYRNGSGDLVILVDQTTKSRSSTDAQFDTDPQSLREGSGIMRSSNRRGRTAIVVIDVFAERRLEVALAEDEQPIEKLGPCRLDPPLAE
jgi:hypothetical protein